MKCLTDSQVARVLEMYRSGYKQAIIARYFSVSQTTISRIVRGKILIADRYIQLSIFDLLNK